MEKLQAADDAAAQAKLVRLRQLKVRQRMANVLTSSPEGSPERPSGPAAGGVPAGKGEGKKKAKKGKKGKGKGDGAEESGPSAPGTDAESVGEKKAKKKKKKARAEGAGEEA